MPFKSNIPATWMRYQSKLWRVSSVALRRNMNRFLWAVACCVNPSVFWSDRLQSLSLSHRHHLPLLNYLRKMCNQTAASHQPTSSLGDTVRPLMSENSNSCSHKSPRPSELVSRGPMGNVVLFFHCTYICVLFKLLRSLARNSLIYLVGKKSPYLSGTKRLETWGSYGNKGVWPQKQA